MKPTTCDTAYFGGIEIIMWTWSANRSRGFFLSSCIPVGNGVSKVREPTLVSSRTSRKCVPLKSLIGHAEHLWRHREIDLRRSQTAVPKVGRKLRQQLLHVFPSTVGRGQS